MVFVKQENSLPGSDTRHGEGENSRATELVRQTLAVVLAGGRGTRLDGLTAWRAKPAVPFGGKFCIIDFTLSNCVNSGIRRVGICTQYRAQSLIRHVHRGWSFLDGRLNEFIELLPVQQRETAEWYRGTADAIYQNTGFLRRHAPKHVLVLAGDHVYKMDYSRMLTEHVERGAEVSIACVEAPLAQSKEFGVITVDERGRVLRFDEKPEGPPPLPGRGDSILASMGIYVFETECLVALLEADAADPASVHDFGHDILPKLPASGRRVYAHEFVKSCVNVANGVPYWRDVGTLDSYWEANLDLVRVSPDLNLYDRAWPIWTYQEQLPPAKCVFDEDDRRGTILDSMVSGGCIVSGSIVRGSILFSSVHLHSYSLVETSVVLPDVEIGRHCVIRRAIIDKHSNVPPGTRIGVDPAEDRQRFSVSEKGITLVTPEMFGQKVHDR